MARPAPLPSEGLNSGDCGCGPNLQYCMSPDSAVVIEKSLRQQLLRMLKKPIKADRPYYAALLDDHEQLNGALIYRYRVQIALDPMIQIPPPVPAKVLPTDVPFTDVTWTGYKRSSQHSRILTSLARGLESEAIRSQPTQNLLVVALVLKSRAH